MYCLKRDITEKICKIYDELKETYHQSQNDFVWSYIVHFLKQNDKQTTNG